MARPVVLPKFIEALRQQFDGGGDYADDLHGPPVRGIRDLTPPEHLVITRPAPETEYLEPEGRLPREVIDMVLGDLDFNDLVRLGTVSLRFRSAIQAFPPYFDMIQHAPEALSALAKTRLLDWHSPTSLRRALQSKTCASCRVDFGGWLLLPTCQRVCYGCLYRNPAMHMTRISYVKKAFGLSERHLRRIPQLFTIPNTYSIGFDGCSEFHNGRTLRLVNTRQAKQLAIDVHGTEEALSDLLPGPLSPLATWPQVKDHAMATALHATPLGLPWRPGGPRRQGGWLDDCPGAAVVRFPHLGAGETIDVGRTCRGCRFEFDNGRPDQWQERQWRAYHREKLATKVRLWSEAGFLEHIVQCGGVRRLLRRWAGNPWPLPGHGSYV